MTSRVLHITTDDTVTLPATDAQTQTIVVYGGRGMGKTNFGSVLCEEFDAADKRFSYIDPMGVAWGLRHSEDGSGKGLDILILGGRHGDLPIEHTGGGVVAEFVATADQSVLIDISSTEDGRRWSVGQKVRFVADYLERLLEVQGEHRRPIMQLIDEAARFAPETIQFKRDANDPVVRCKEMLGQLVEEGRNGGIGVTLITQRSARMAKAVSELAEMMVAFRIIGPNSTEAVLDWFGSHVPKARHNELLEQLRKLPRGTALIVSPGWLEFEGVAAIRLRHTFDSSKTPTGTEKRLAKAGKKADLDKLRAQIAATVEKAEADNPGKLRKELAEAKRQIAVQDKTITELQARKPAGTERRVEVPVLKDAQIARLDALAEKVTTTFGKLHELTDSLYKSASEIRAAAAKTTVPAPAPRLNPPTKNPGSGGRPVERPHRPTPRVVSAAADADGALSKPEQRILDSLAWWDAAGIAEPSRQQAAFGARYTVNGHFNNIVGALNTKGLVRYPKGDHIALTNAGAMLAQAPDTPASVSGLIDMTRDVLRSEPQRRLFNAMVTADADGHEELTREELAELCKPPYTVNGHFNNIVGALNSIGVLRYPRGNYVALGEMFEAVPA